MKPNWSNAPRRRVTKQSSPILGVMSEVRLLGGKGNQSASHALMINQINKALPGDNRDALVLVLKRGARRERKLIGEGRYDERVTFNRLNLNYERVGDVAEMLGIAKAISVPAHIKRDRFEGDQRYDLEEWAIKFARKEGRCSHEHLANIRTWQAQGCPQWRFKTMWDDMMGELPDEFTQSKSPGRPKGSKNKPKIAIHPYDMKLGYLKEGKRVQIRVMEALMLQAERYAAKHTYDTQFANFLLDITERAEAAYEKRPKGPESDDWAGMDGEDRLYAPLAVPCFENALLGMDGASILYHYRPYARAVLEPWLVQAALDRRKTRFTRSQQQRIVNRTRQPEKVNWPDRFDPDVISYRGPGRPAANEGISE